MAAKVTISEKENILRYYRNEMPERLPNPSAGLFTKHPIMGFMERTDDGGTKDWFGVEYVYEPLSKASLPDPAKPRVITDITKWREQLVIPDVDNHDWEKAAKIDEIGDDIREVKAVSLLIQCGIFERFHALLGMEEAYVALIEEPEESKALISALADYKYKLFSKLIEYYKPDIIRQHDDYGTQIGMQMDPKIWREMIKPHIARFVELCHSKGVFYEQHSCGKVEDIVPDLCEIGVDSWQGMHINDVPKLKKITGQKLGYHMSMSVSDYQVADFAGKLTEADLRKTVRETVMACAQGGCYFPVYAPLGGPWWGIAIIDEEVNKCRQEIEY